MSFEESVYEIKPNHQNHHFNYSMTLHGGHRENIVFQDWITQNKGVFIASCIALVLIAVFYEGLKSLHIKVERDFRTYLIVNKHVIDSTARQMFNIHHLSQTLVYAVQATVAYFLMLAAMTFNAWIFVSIISGLTLGYFLFGFMRVHPESSSISEYC